MTETPMTPPRMAKALQTPPAPKKPVRQNSEEKKTFADQYQDQYQYQYQYQDQDQDQDQYQYQDDYEMPPEDGLWDFVLSKKGGVTVTEVEEFLSTVPKNTHLADTVDDLIDEAYFSNIISGEVAVWLLKFGMEHLDFDPNWERMSKKKKVHPAVRAYAIEMCRKSGV